MRRNLIVVCGLVVGATAAATFFYPKENKIGHYTLESVGSIKPLVIRSDSSTEAPQPFRQINLVSIAEVAPKQYVLANYADILLFDAAKGSVCSMSVDSSAYVALPESSTTPSDRKFIYNPTGVFALNANEIYIANYKGNNILKATADIANCSLKIVGEYVSSTSGGPENVAASREHDLIVSANYDASTVTAFSLSSGKELWSAPVGQAHGVTIFRNKVYATSLTERKIFEINAETGQVIRSNGKIGWNPLEGEYLWPTSIGATADGRLIVSDAQSGFVSFLNPKTLNAESYFGGNGPGYDLLNYPYSAVPIRNEIVLLSSMRGHLIFLDSKGTKVIDSFASLRTGWPDSVHQAEPFGKGWDKYVGEAGTRLHFVNNDYKLGFAHLHPEKSGPVIRVPNISTLFNTSAYIYFLQGAQTEDHVSILFSSSSRSMIGVVENEGRPPVLMTKKIPTDSWLINGNIVSGDGQVATVGEISKEFQGRAATLYKALDQRGWLSTKALAASGVLPEDLPTEEITLKPTFSNVFVSPAARTFKYVYDKCNDAACDVTALRQAASAYYEEAKTYSYVNLDELLLIGMLSGVSINSDPLKHAKKDVTFNDCNVGKYYDGYGPRSLQTSTLLDYLSAIDIEHSVLCFALPKANGATLGNILFGWYSKDEIPRKISLYGLHNRNGKTIEKLITEITSPKFFTINGVHFSDISLPSHKPYKQYLLRLQEGGKENRLVLRALVPTLLPIRAKPVDELLQLADAVSTSIPYGPGVAELAPGSACTADGVLQQLHQVPSAHCGIYAQIFASKLPPSAKWAVYDITSVDGRTHSVVEVDTNGKKTTYDPTLGVSYPCSTDSMIKGSCRFEDLRSLRKTNPALSIFLGPGFFYESKIARTYKTLDEMAAPYLALCTQ